MNIFSVSISSNAALKLQLQQHVQERKLLRMISIKQQETPDWAFVQQPLATYSDDSIKQPVADTMEINGNC